MKLYLIRVGVLAPVFAGSLVVFAGTRNEKQKDRVDTSKMQRSKENAVKTKLGDVREQIGALSLC